MYKFTVEYYFERYHTGNINEDRTRTGIVFANDRKEAINKVCKGDRSFICSKNITFEETKEGAEQ